MTAALIVFIASVATVGLTSLQVVNISHDRRIRAAVTSLLQGMAVLTLYRVVPHVETFEAGAAFVIGGMVGGQITLYVSGRRKKT